MQQKFKKSKLVGNSAEPMTIGIVGTKVFVKEHYYAKVMEIKFSSSRKANHFYNSIKLV